MDKYNELLPKDFEWKTYIMLNSDVGNNKKDAISHYLNYGIKENRLYKIDKNIIPEDFNWKNYVLLNSDLNHINNKYVALNHYINFGYKEKRQYKIFNNFINSDYDDKYFICNNLEFVYPKISVIIPNYNNSKYLLQRLTSVYSQTLKPSEVIIIDDCSTDDSVKIIKKYISNQSIPTQLIVNIENTGSGYYNWISGIKMAKNDLIWIAESDDYCDLTFLEILSKEFIDKSVSISYCKTNFVNENGETIWTIDKYLDERWNMNFKKATNNLVKDKFGHLNIIPNVSSCIFKKPDYCLLYELNNILNMNIKLVLDWIFYLLISKNSSISYSTKVNNYYLVRESSVSQQIQKSNTFFMEHKFIMSFIINNFNINENSVAQLYINLQKHCIESNKSVDILNNIYKINTLKLNIKNNKDTILIFSYGFLLGGGEIFPIYLANKLYEKSINVVFMVMDSNPINTKIFKLLNKNIKIINNTRYISELINDFDITHINTHHQSCDSIILNYCINNPNKIKHYITDHGMYNIKSPDTNHLLNLINKNKSNIIYINDNNKNNFENVDTYKCNIPVSIDNYVDYEKVDRRTYNIKDTDFVITLASRCIKEKGWKEMIFIFDKINHLFKNVKLLLIGDYNNDFGMKLKKECENPNIIFLGHKSKIKRFYEISDLGILPTYYASESNPIVLIECLYANKPFIVTNIGETSRMLIGQKDYAGSIIELKNGKIDANKYYIEIIKYITDKEYYNSKINEIKYAIDKFDINLVVNRYVEMFIK